MYFTIIFLNAPEGPSYSYDLVFHPTPTWFQGHKMILSLSEINNAFKELLKTIPEEYVEISDGHKVHSNFAPQGIVKIVCHTGGHASDLDLENLTNEIKECGFEALVC
jgi:hypothetical protein